MFVMTDAHSNLVNPFQLNKLFPQSITNFIPLIVLILILVHACPAQSQESASDGAVNRPNIVLIMADDLGYDDLSCCGATKFKTPNIDELATQGMQFHNYR